MRTLTQRLSENTAIDAMPLWKRMSIDEYAEFEKAMGAKLQKKGEIWWHRVRPYFYRPLFPFVELSPSETKRSFGKFAAVQHPVSAKHLHNSYMNLLVLNNLKLIRKTVLGRASDEESKSHPNA